MCWFGPKSCEDRLHSRYDFRLMISSIPSKVKALFLKDVRKANRLQENVFGDRYFHSWRAPIRELLAHRVLELVKERLLVLKNGVNGREGHIRHIVRGAETLHQELIYFCTRDLTIRGVADLRFDPIQQFGEFHRADWTFFA